MRQAYDEFARPWRLAAALALVPGIVLLVFAWGWPALGVAVAAPIVVAESGRRTDHGVRVFPLAASLAAPLWVLERALCAWAAVIMRLVIGGVPYAGGILRRAATPSHVLVRRHRHAIHAPLPEPPRHRAPWA